MTLNAANLLTLSRLVLAPVFVAAFLAGQKGTAFAVFCVAGFTDLIDGTVARLLKQHSKGGALLDPMADKLLMQSAFVLLFLSGLLPWWFFVLALFRDLMIVSGIIYFEVKKAALPYRPTWVSKFATLFGLLVAVLGLLRWWRRDLVPLELSLWHFGVICVTTALIAVSGAQYIIMGLKIRRGNPT